MSSKEKAPVTLKLDSILQSIAASEFHSAYDPDVDAERTPRLSAASGGSGASGGTSAADTWALLPTLQQLEAMSVECAAPFVGALVVAVALCSGSLYKLNASADQGGKWKLRHVVLTHSTLHLFHINSDPTALPISSLPVTSSQSFVDNELVMRVHGTGETPDGFLVKRIWTLRAESQQSFAQWTQAIGKNALRVREPRTVSRSASERSVSVPRSQNLRMNSDQSMPNMARQATTAEFSEREARMRAQHLEYMALQRENAAILRRAMEERESLASTPVTPTTPVTPVQQPTKLHKAKSTAAINDKTNQMQLISGMYSLW
ncbi:hypothetical protein CcCBS67573_g01401 [Chytriomyces confervae]|uniref:PH domain-containing protein n=1 Tax=Chytriomyces confervae TaxID=246404 RepID=A0A507FLP4_9FUNG|nr:hypothetical protein CcCBS67573_g01401 [Chytriomyces confervae]